MVPKVLSISKSNFAWNSLRKEHHIAHVAEKKYAKRGGDQQKVTSFLWGGRRKVTLGDMGGGGVKNLKKRGDVLCERPLGLFSKLINFMH